MNLKTTLLALLVTAFALLATSQGTKPTSSPDALKPVTYLIGGTWTAQGELPGLGKFTAGRTYRWALGGNFIEQRNVMKFAAGKMETKGIIGWDSVKNKIVAWGFGNDGGIATSHAAAPTAIAIHFEGVRVGKFNAGPISATLTRQGKTEFTEVAESKNGDAWMPMFTFTFTRAQ